MNLTELQTHMKVLLSTGDSAEVTALNESDQTVEVRKISNWWGP